MKTVTQQLEMKSEFKHFQGSYYSMHLNIADNISTSFCSPSEKRNAYSITWASIAVVLRFRAFQQVFHPCFSSDEERREANLF